MADLIGTERAEYVQNMFTQIAHRYDLMNRLMTFGQDLRWRKEVIQRAHLPAGGQLLDLGTGTGDLAREALRQHSDCRVVAADFTIEMMLFGKARLEPEGKLSWMAADAQQVPVHKDLFDATVSAFLLRNVSDLMLALQEQYRVLKPGGRLVCLDTTPPPDGLLGFFVRFHLHTVIPALGRWISGNIPAYRYLPESTEKFLEPDQLAELLVEAGFHDIDYKKYMFGTVAIYWGIK